MTEGFPPIGVWWHDDVLTHDTGTGIWEQPGSDLVEVLDRHPENDVRIRNMRSMLERGPLSDQISWHAGRHATVEEISTVHSDEYIAAIEAFSEAGGGRLADDSTVVSAGTWDAALAAAGTTLAAADAVISGEVGTALALVRPPGHHAQPTVADGYCIFNNAALAAERARASGLDRIAIVDWDVHHGNGTQACFYGRADVLTISLHMKTGPWGPTHPQTGSATESGHGDGEGFNLNLELPIGSGDRAYELAMREVVAPVLTQFRPDMVIGACGQDASTFDPNGRQNVTMDGFRTIGTVVREAAAELAAGRLLLVQEGGYAPTYSAYCLHATLEGALDGVERLEDPLAYIPDDPERATEVIAALVAATPTRWGLGHGRIQNREIAR
jgi:acetoin utilization deacetylase AcuC-like enzyme